MTEDLDSVWSSARSQPDVLLQPDGAGPNVQSDVGYLGSAGWKFHCFPNRFDSDRLKN